MSPDSAPASSGGHTCPWWLLFTFDNPLRRLIHKPEVILSPYLGPGDTVLDIGCGMGYFSIPMARLVGQDGQVIAADLQEQMLAGLQKRAENAGLAERIQPHRSFPDDIGVDQPVDFVLAFWMVHEVRDQGHFLGQVFELLNPGGSFLVVEPRIHVSGKAFDKTLSLAQEIGFRALERPRVRASRAVLLGN